MLGDKLKTLREQLELTQQEMADKIGIARGTYAHYEINRREPDNETIKQLAMFFNVSTDYLLGISDNPVVTRPTDTIPVSGKGRKLPIIGTVKAGPDGLAYMDQQGEEWADEEDIPNGATYYWLQIKGDSMIGEGIMPGDLALVREQPEVEYGQLGIAIIDGEEGTLKRIYKKDDSIVLQSANAKYPPRIFAGAEINTVKIVGKVKVTKRKY